MANEEGSGPTLPLSWTRNNPGPLEPFQRAGEELRFAMTLDFDIAVFGWLAAYQRFVEMQHAFARREPTPLCLAEVTLGKGVTETFRAEGGYAVTIECGPHDDAAAFEVAFQAIRNALAALGLTADPSHLQPFKRSYRLTSVLLREARSDRLAKDFGLFESVKADDSLAVREDGAKVTAAADGAIIFRYPNAAVGEPWLYLAETDQRGTTLSQGECHLA